MLTDAAQRTRSGGVQSRRELLVAGSALAAVTAYLRWPLLNPETLWFDDAWVAYAHRAPWGDLTEIALGAPGFSIVLRLWYGVVGFGSLQSQAIPFAAAVAAPPVAYWVLRQRTRVVAAVFAAMWIVVSPVHLTYSGRVKHYSTEVLICLVLMHTSWRAIEEPERPGVWRNLGVVSLIAVSISFPLAVVAAPACAIPLLSRLWRERRFDPSLTWLLLPAVATPLWFVIVIRHRQYPNLIRFWEDAYVQTDAGLFVTIESILGRIADTARFLAPGPYPISVAVITILVAAALWRSPWKASIMVLIFVAALALAMAHRAPLGGGRTDLYLLGGLVLTTGLGLDVILSDRQWTGPLSAIALAGVVGLALVAVDRPTYPDQQATELIADIEDRREPGDAVLVYHNAKFAWLAYTDVPAEVIPQWAPYGVHFLDERVVQQGFPSRSDVAASLHRLDNVDVDGRLYLVGTDLRWSWQATIDALVEVGWRIVEQDTEGRGRLVTFEPGDQ